MSRIVYLNGEWLAEEEAKVSIFDRGYVFADAIYEVTCVLDGKLLDYDGHAARLKRSTGAIGINMPVDDETLLSLHREIAARNDMTEGLIYLQVSRGNPGDRDFMFEKDMTPTFSMFTQKKQVTETKSAKNGIAVVTMEDLRWGRCDIKTVQLLYPSLAKMEAHDKGADDAWLVRDGEITEQTSATAYIVTADDVVITRPLSHVVLPGITRASALQIAARNGMKVEERAFTVEEALAAKEAFYTSASNFITPVVSIDGKAIGDGKPGALTMKLRELYIADRRANAI
ncbi:D-amino-acid transaminase [Martelella endophytica]|uniref:Probable branched-chain-amino-acid aminotransferase n=1 Tax=Martelella endophytica TaxID=1486262 RepID=A0A0D5LN56_MAREN|nr:D-amino-acid transaminase [Martelella endophytica]AJY45360.1 D-amino acid aminotransferase [Martelella endophytica]